MYNPLLAGDVDLGRLRPVLAEVFGVPLGNVDVGHEDELENRDWDAQVFGDYSPRDGDISCALSVYAVNEVLSQPSEERLSLELARSLGIAVLFPPVPEISPSLWRIVTPRGEVAYARLHEPEDDDDLLRVTDVEIEVPELPGAAVSRFPDVIKRLQLPTPVVDAHIPGEVGEDLRELRGLAVNWERLTVRMASGWPPSRWYPAGMYAEDLRYRDEAQRLAEEISTGGDGSLLGMLSELDAVYRDMTVDDGGRALAEAYGLAVGELAGRPWYWRRRPVELPWEG